MRHHSAEVARYRAMVRVTVRHIWVSLSQGHPEHALFSAAYERLLKPPKVTGDRNAPMCPHRNADHRACCIRSPK